MNPLVSIIVPCYNQAQYLPETLNSLLVQTYLDWECIIVNDGSRDNTEEVAKQYCDKDKRFIYIYKENAGLSEARNTGIKTSNGDYILPLDADDLIAEAYISEAVYILDNNPNIKIVYGKAEFFGSINGAWELPLYSLEEMLLGNIIYCSAFFRKDDFEKTLGYNKNMIYGWEDWDFWLSILETGGDVYQIPKLMFYYRIKETSMCTGIGDDENIKGKIRRQVYINHIDLYTKLFLDPISSYEKSKYYETSLNNVLNSKNYKVGKKMLTPIRLLFHLFKKIIRFVYPEKGIKYKIK